jgi:hypothetical protein
MKNKNMHENMESSTEAAWHSSCWTSPYPRLSRYKPDPIWFWEFILKFIIRTIVNNKNDIFINYADINIYNIQ